MIRTQNLAEGKCVILKICYEIKFLIEPKIRCYSQSF